MVILTHFLYVLFLCLILAYRCGANIYEAGLFVKQFHSNQTLQQLIFPINTSSMGEEGVISEMATCRDRFTMRNALVRGSNPLKLMLSVSNTQFTYCSNTKLCIFPNSLYSMCYSLCNVLFNLVGNGIPPKCKR